VIIEAKASHTISLSPKLKLNMTDSQSCKLVHGAPVRQSSEASEALDEPLNISETSGKTAGHLKPISQVEICHDYVEMLQFLEPDPRDAILVSYLEPKTNERFYVIPEPTTSRFKKADDVLSYNVERWISLLNKMDELVVRYKTVSGRLKKPDLEQQQWFLEWSIAYKTRSRQSSKWYRLWKDEDENNLNMKIAKARETVMQMSEDVLKLETAYCRSKYNKAEKKARMTTAAGFIDEDAEDMIAFE